MYLMYVTYIPPGPPGEHACVSGIQKRRIEDNRHYVRTVIETNLLCAKQNIGLRGHRENEKSSNKGNFLEILNVIARHDKIVKDRAKKCSLYICSDTEYTFEFAWK